MNPLNQPSQDWQTCDRFLELKSRWMTLIGEHLQDHRGDILEYWRIETADSVIVLPLCGDRLLLAAPSYRPGISQATLDFPGGRIPAAHPPDQAAIAALTRELGISATVITRLTPLNATGWAVNSSFSSQKLYGFVAELDSTDLTLETSQAISYAATHAGIQELLQVLTCLQCRAVLLEWWCRRLG
jgi:hypothetical protein